MIISKLIQVTFRARVSLELIDFILCRVYFRNVSSELTWCTTLVFWGLNVLRKKSITVDIKRMRCHVGAADGVQRAITSLENVSTEIFLVNNTGF